MKSDTLCKVLGTRIRALRKSRNISQERLAELAELHPTYISDIERGKVNSSISVYNCIAEALQITLAELVEFPAGKRNAVDNAILVLFTEARQLPSQKKSVFLEATKGILSGLKTQDNDSTQ